MTTDNKDHLVVNGAARRREAVLFLNIAEKKKSVFKINDHHLLHKHTEADDVTTRAREFRTAFLRNFLNFVCLRVVLVKFFSTKPRLSLYNVGQVTSWKRKQR